jgi:L-threonylcarbamoyladenylate synthase
MQILTKEKIESNWKILRKKIFIYPTDTIYGIGCDATNKELVARVRDIKQRPDTPFSVIVPSKKWIFDNCVINAEAKTWIEKLPGHYTLILKPKGNVVAGNVASTDSLGIRIPDNWFSKIVAKLGKPIITTSVNLSGNNFMTSLEDLDCQIKSKIDFIIYEGKKEGRPSTIVDLTEDKIKLIKR